jgi:hypothetical protein
MRRPAQHARDDGVPAATHLLAVWRRGLDGARGVPSEMGYRAATVAAPHREVFETGMDFFRFHRVWAGAGALIALEGLSAKSATKINGAWHRA